MERMVSLSRIERLTFKTTVLIVSMELGVIPVLTRAFAVLETKTVVTEGVGTGEDKAKARDDAIADAQRRAVEQVVGVLVNAETLVQNSALIKDEVYTRSEGFIKSYEPVEGSERWDGHDVFHIKLRAVVMVGKVQQALGATCKDLRIRGNPKVIVAIADVGQFDESLRGAAQGYIEECLQDEDLRVLDCQQLGDVQKKELQRLQRLDQPGSYEALRLQNDTDLIILGKLTVRSKGKSNIPGTEEVYGADVTLDARIIWTDTGEIVARSRETQTGPGFTQESAAESAIQKASQSWCAKNLCRVKMASINPAATYEIKLLRVNNTAPVDRLITSIRNLRFAQDAKLRTFEQGAAIVELQYASSTESLRRELERWIVIKSVTGRTYTAVLSP